MIHPARIAESRDAAKRIHGISMPSASVLATERIIEPYVLTPWTEAVDKAADLVPKAVTVDSVAEVAKVVSSVYSRYSHLTSLNDKLKKRWETDDNFHRRNFVESINAAIGVNTRDLLNDERSEAFIADRLKASTDLIVTLNKEMVERVTRQIWEGISRGDDSITIKKFILENTEDYPAWRAKLIARDQSNKLFSGLTEYRQRDLGIEEYIWETVRDGAVRDEHAPREGLPFRWDAPPNGGPPGWAIQCRCTSGIDPRTIRGLF